jgi:hypothetical protein
MNDPPLANLVAPGPGPSLLLRPFGCVGCPVLAPGAESHQAWPACVRQTEGHRSRDDSFDELHRHRRRHDLRQSQARCTVEATELCVRPLAAARAHQHVHIVGGCPSTLFGLIDAGGIDSLDDQQLGVGMHGAPTGSQDRDRALVVPVVEDRFQEIGIRPSRHFLEHVTTHDLTPISKTPRAELRTSSFDHVRKIEEHRLQRRVGTKNAGEKRAASAADVDDLAESCEVVRGGHGRRLAS